MISGTGTYRAVVPVGPLRQIDTATLFSMTPAARMSPIDNFIVNTNTLNTVYLTYANQQQNWIPEIGHIVFLGYMSAVESYFRAVISGLINVDHHTRRLAGPKQLSFALATNAKRTELLPEALMENIAFSTSGSIESAIKDLVGLDKLSDDFTSALAEFKKLCEVRHCCVHRFGKLGSQNAMRLGFDTHGPMIEQPFSPTLNDTILIADSLQTMVKTANNFLFREVLNRTVGASLDGKLPWSWHWHKGRDRGRFAAYYDLFAIKLARPGTATASELYGSFKAEHAKRVEAHRRRAAA